MAARQKCSSVLLVLSSLVIMIKAQYAFEKVTENEINLDSVKGF